MCGGPVQPEPAPATQNLAVGQVTHAYSTSRRTAGTHSPYEAAYTRLMSSGWMQPSLCGAHCGRPHDGHVAPCPRRGPPAAFSSESDQRRASTAAVSGQVVLYGGQGSPFVDVTAGPVGAGTARRYWHGASAASRLLLFRSSEAGEGGTSVCRGSDQVSSGPGLLDVHLRGPCAA